MTTDSNAGLRALLHVATLLADALQASRGWEIDDGNSDGRSDLSGRIQRGHNDRDRADSAVAVARAALDDVEIPSL